jgi:hypothetical protein
MCRTRVRRRSGSKKQVPGLLLVRSRVRLVGAAQHVGPAGAPVTPEVEKKILSRYEVDPRVRPGL